MPKPKQEMTPWRRHLLTQRRKTVARRQHKVEYIGPNYVKFTCTTCGYTEEGKPSQQGTMDEQMTKKMIGYWNGNGGIGGPCKGCTQALRDRLYPLDMKPGDRR